MNCEFCDSPLQPGNQTCPGCGAAQSVAPPVVELPPVVPTHPPISAPQSVTAPLTMGTAFRRSLKHYGNFSGRSRRSEYWWSLLANFLLMIPVVVVLGIVVGLVAQDSEETASILVIVLYVAFIAAWAIPFGMALTVRRLHDIGKSGWWLLFMILISLIPFVGLIGSIFLLVWYCTDSQVGDNRFGPNPKVSID